MFGSAIQKPKWSFLSLEKQLSTELQQKLQEEIQTPPRFTNDAMVTVVCATEGYPVSPRGDRITGIEEASSSKGIEKCMWPASASMENNNQ